MIIHDLPFHIGAVDTKENPFELPNTYPFHLAYNNAYNFLFQESNTQLDEILEKAYRFGQLIGTPLDESSFGMPYADDFLNFINSISLPIGSTVLEIGAGVGYLSRCLIEAGMQTTSIEPGVGYESHWRKNKIKVINDFFPSKQVIGKFDLIFGYAVLEHIKSPIDFLRHVSSQLHQQGHAVFSVPDCTDELLLGDPSILFHEHFNYFEAGSLCRLMEAVGMHASVVKSGYGRCLYVVASKTAFPASGPSISLESSVLATYPKRCETLIDGVRKKIIEISNLGETGIYCPARCLGFLDKDLCVRFFDDDPNLLGKFLPPFPNHIENMRMLIREPVATVIVMSRTFGKEISGKLRKLGYRGSILSLEEVIRSTRLGNE